MKDIIAYIYDDDGRVYKRKELSDSDEIESFLSEEMENKWVEQHYSGYYLNLHLPEVWSPEYTFSYKEFMNYLPYEKRYNCFIEPYLKEKKAEIMKDLRNNGCYESKFFGFELKDKSQLCQEESF